MTASWEAKFPREFTLPATVGLVVVLVTTIVLLAISSRKTRKLLGVKGTKYIVDEDGAHVVRRCDSLTTYSKPPYLRELGSKQTLDVFQAQRASTDKRAVLAKTSTPARVKRNRSTEVLTQRASRLSDTAGRRVLRRSPADSSLFFTVRAN